MTEPDATTTQPPRKRRRWTVVGFIVAVVIFAAITFALAGLLTTMFNRTQEAKNPFVRLVDVGENTTDPAVWGVNWPLEYDGYRRTVDTTHTRYGGSEGTPPKSRLEKDPWLTRMFAGYAFAIDFRERRGHAYMLYDQSQTKRVQERPQTGACLHCHASIIPTYRRVGSEKQGKTLADANGFDWPAVFAGFDALAPFRTSKHTANCSRPPMDRRTKRSRCPAGRAYRRLPPRGSRLPRRPPPRRWRITPVRLIPSRASTVTIRSRWSCASRAPRS